MLKSTVVLLKKDQVRCVTVKNEFFCLRDEDGSVRRSDINSFPRHHLPKTRRKWGLVADVMASAGTAEPNSWQRENEV